MEKQINKKSNRAITMISLIVTIIILLILAGVTIAMLTNSGIIDKANDAAKATNLAETREQLELDILDKQAELMSGEEKRGELTQKELEDIIEKYGELQDDGDTIVTEYGNISLKEIMSGDVKLADTNTSGNENNSQEINNLKQEIEDLKNKVGFINDNLKYSTEETICGTWIDGKPIYRIVISFNPKTCKPDSWTKVYDATSLNIETIIGRSGFIVNNNGSAYIPIPYVNNVVTNYCIEMYYNIKDKGIMIGYGKAWTETQLAAQSNATLIIEYTKTTD